MRSWLGYLKNMKYTLRYFGRGTCLIHVSVLYIMCIAHPFYVCGDDRIICYPGANDLTGGPGDA